MKTLGGATFAWNAISQDYCIIECLECLYALCDEISIVYGGTDGTPELIEDWIASKLLASKHLKKLKWYIIDEHEWNAHLGREKLSYFSNIAIQSLSTDWVYYQQADEVTHEDYFQVIRSAIESSTNEGFMVRRLNLWASSHTMLDVPQHRKPVSTEIIRLVKKGYWSVDDAESIACPVNSVLPVNMYHMGFVRDRKKHIDKIIHMQRDVFLMDYDKRVHDCEDELFHPWRFGFTPKDIVPIPDKHLPIFVDKWAMDRRCPVFKDDEHDLAKEFLIHINFDMSHVRLLRFPNLSMIANNVIDSLYKEREC